MEEDLSDPDCVLSSKNEEENNRQIDLFVSTCKELFAMDGITNLSNSDIKKFLIAKKGHKGKAMDALAASLVYYLLTTRHGARNLELMT
jgi:hypothetical protein